MYAAVKKIPKSRTVDNEKEIPPHSYIPPYTVGELYTDIQKKAKDIAAGDEAEPHHYHHTQELYTM